MKSIKNRVLAFVYKRPSLQIRLSGVKRILGRTKAPAFSGMGMMTESMPPWLSGDTQLNRDFSNARAIILKELRNEKFVLTAFADVPDIQMFVEGLMWNRYALFWSAAHAAAEVASRGVSKLNFVECGVCDGLGA